MEMYAYRTTAADKRETVSMLALMIMVMDFSFACNGAHMIENMNRFLYWNVVAHLCFCVQLLLLLVILRWLRLMHTWSENLLECTIIPDDFLFFGLIQWGVITLHIHLGGRGSLWCWRGRTRGSHATALWIYHRMSATSNSAIINQFIFCTWRKLILLLFE